MCGPPASPATRWADGFGWDAEDARTRRWMPQGITSTADARAGGSQQDRAVLAISWYAPRVEGRTDGVRVTFVDLSEPGGRRYAHVLLVEPAGDGPAARPWRPVAVHAGGLVWCGDLLYVAATYGGLRVFDLRMLARVDPRQFLGHRYVLPQRGSYLPGAGTCMRYSFLSLDHGGPGVGLWAGEYARTTGATAIARFAVDPGDGSLLASAGIARPDTVRTLPLARMQGLARAESAYVVTTSRGPRLPGDLWTGEPDGVFRRRFAALPAGPEAVCAWPAREQFWTLTEYPGRRSVLALAADAGVSRRS